MEVASSLVRSLYVHVPFCTSKCRYCAFDSRSFDERICRDWLAALEWERAKRGPLLSTPLRSIYVGGGTPTCLPEDALRRLLAPLGALASESTEFSVEANPSGIAAAAAHLLRDCGVNRVSIGAQSFRDETLQWLGRTHRAEEVPRAVEAFRDAGILNVGLDLIYGLPGGTVEEWGGTLEAALALPIAHLSCYALSYDEPSRLAREAARGDLTPCDDATQERQYFLALRMAAEAGLEPYELSNFARAGRRCLHNESCWLYEPYVGLGPSAASFVDGRRFRNIVGVEPYIRRIRSERDPETFSESLSLPTARAEAAMLALRRTEGIDRIEYAERWGSDVVEAFPTSICRHRDLGRLSVDPRRVRLTEAALFTADSLFADLLDEAGNQG